MFAVGFADVIVVGYWHPRGTTLESPVMWLVVAMVNFVRIAEGNARIPRLRTVAIAANLMAVAVEFLRVGLTIREVTAAWGSGYIWRYFQVNFTWWLPYGITALLALIETLFSLRRGGIEPAFPA